jgi:ParB/RepB/Spo0J family partition protein
MSTLYESQTREFKEIALSAISGTRNKNNFGRGNPEKDPEVNELKENIRQHGLIHPITVMETDKSTAENKEYEVVVGNRRLAAWKKAFPDSETIRCFVLPKDTSTPRKDMLTVSENFLRVDYNPQDKGKVIQMLLPYWENDLNKLAKALGYETPVVLKEWLDLLEVPEEVMDRLKGPEPLKAKRARLIRKLPLDLQLTAVDIINEKGGDTYDIRRFVYALKANPTASPQQIADMIQKEPRTKSLLVSLNENENMALELAKDDFRVSKTELVKKATNEFLTKHSYLDADGRLVKRQTKTTSTATDASKESA